MKKIIVTALLLTSAAACHALEATITWNPVIEATDGHALAVDSYRLYCGTTPGEYNRVLDVGAEASATVDSLAYGTDYYFAIKAVASGRESALSEEITWSSPDDPAQTQPTASNLSIETILTTPEGPVETGVPVFVAAGFADTDAVDAHVAEWAWGDGASTAGNVNETDRIIYGSHAYAKPGVYPVELGLMDSSGETATAECEDYIVAFDPSGGFVVGGGWISAPEGRASFGFVAAYTKGNKTTTPGCEFRFKSGTLNVHGTVCDQLVVKGRNSAAQISGEGILNGLDNCGFTIWAGDGAVDTFRIQVWTVDASGTQTVVYDNGSELPLGGGAIAIKAK